jgi:hypothetical protein
MGRKSNHTEDYKRRRWIAPPAATTPGAREIAALVPIGYPGGHIRFTSTSTHGFVRLHRGVLQLSAAALRH